MADKEIIDKTANMGVGASPVRHMPELSPRAPGASIFDSTSPRTAAPNNTPTATNARVFFNNDSKQKNPTMCAIKDRLDRLGVVQNFLESLPKPVQRRVKALHIINDERSTLEKKYQEEKRALERKYSELYAPLYNKRSDIVNGVFQPTKEELGEEEDVAVEKEAVDVNGIPEFWLTALRNNDEVGQDITEKDAEVLAHLVDIKSTLLDSSKGFGLEFHFNSNEFFTNKILTKKYHMADEDEPVLDHAEGCDIDWQQGKNVTVKLMKKKQKQKGGKGTRTVTKQEPCESFFNFFSPPKMPDEEDETEMDEEEEDNLQNMLEADYDIGCVIKERIVPNAILWYTGEAVEDDDYEDEDDDENEDFETDSDEDDDSDEGPKGRGSGAKGRGGRPGKPPGGGAKGGKPPGAAAGQENPQECKQQ